MDESDPKCKFELYHTMIEAGILPVGSTSGNVNLLLEALPLEEQRKLKRKFRKLWRRAADEKKLDTRSQRVFYGRGYAKQTRGQTRSRRRLVRDFLLRDRNVK